MRRIPVFIILLTVLFSACGGQNIKETEQREIEVFIEQGGNRIEIKNNTAELRRIPFSLIFTFSRPDSIFVNASFNSETYNNAIIGIPLNELIGFKNPGIDEEPFNRQNLLYISAATPNLWYYTDDTDHRFNLVKKSDPSIICQRNIISFMDIDSESNITEITKIKRDSIYLVILSVDWNEDYTRMIEKNRKMIRLKFII